MAPLLFLSKAASSWLLFRRSNAEGLLPAFFSRRRYSTAPPSCLSKEGGSRTLSAADLRAILGSSHRLFVETLSGVAMTRSSDIEGGTSGIAGAVLFPSQDGGAESPFHAHTSLERLLVAAFNSLRFYHRLLHVRSTQLHNRVFGNGYDNTSGPQNGRSARRRLSTSGPSGRQDYLEEANRETRQTSGGRGVPSRSVIMGSCRRDGRNVGNGVVDGLHGGRERRSLGGEEEKVEIVEQTAPSSSSASVNSVFGLFTSLLRSEIFVAADLPRAASDCLWLMTVGGGGDFDGLSGGRVSSGSSSSVANRRTSSSGFGGEPIDGVLEEGEQEEELQEQSLVGDDGGLVGNGGPDSFPGLISRDNRSSLSAGAFPAGAERRRGGTGGASGTDASAVVRVGREKMVAQFLPRENLRLQLMLCSLRCLGTSSRDVE